MLTRINTSGGGHQAISSLSGFKENWCALCNSDTQLHPDLESLLSKARHSRPDVVAFYGDSVLVPRVGEPWPKLLPDFNETKFLSSNYIQDLLLVREDVLLDVVSSSTKADSHLIYKSILHVVANGRAISRITEILSRSPEQQPTISHVDRLEITREWFAKNNSHWSVREGLKQGMLEIYRLGFSDVHVSLVIPTIQASFQNEDVPMIHKLLDSIADTDWNHENIEIIIGDDTGEFSFDTSDFPFRVRVLNTTREHGESFNYSKKMNTLWKEALYENIVFLNDDLAIRNPCWLKSLMSLSTMTDVGAVGAKLLFPDGKFQHVGMPIGPKGVAAHAYHNALPSTQTYLDLADVQREWSCVTGAVTATRKTLLKQIGGFDETFPLDYSDVDVCLKLRLLGYKVVYTPHCEMTHFDSASRGKNKTTASQTSIFLQRWAEWIESDPSYHPALTRDDLAFSVRPDYVPSWGI